MQSSVNTVNLEPKIRSITIRGRAATGIEIAGRTVICRGSVVRIGAIHDEVWIEGPTFQDPEAAIDQIRHAIPNLDVFTFSQRLPDSQPQYQFPVEWQNFAVIPITTFEDWWEKRLPQESRKNVRRAGKRGVVVREVSLDDAFVEGVVSIYNETPIRQGKKFPKYGQTFEVVKKTLNELAHRSTFLGAYCGDELAGFIQLVRVGKILSVLAISSKAAHFDKRPTNALLAKGVEIACGNGSSHLAYGRYMYGNKYDELTEFKRRNGFEKVLVPGYAVPLTLKGKVACQFGFHKGWLELLPPSLINVATSLRSGYLKKKGMKRADVAEQ
jgi:hypothetical protein